MRIARLGLAQLIRPRLSDNPFVVSMREIRNMPPVLSVKAYKGLAAQRFTRLGHINVFCGRNNSGKSTILEAIATSGNGGVVAPQSFFEDLEKAGTRACAARLYDRVWSSVVQNARDLVTRHNGILTESDAAAAVGKLRKDVESEILRQVDPQKNAMLVQALKGDVLELEKSLSSFFGATYKNGFRAILIPAQRKLDTQDTLELPPSLDPSGEGILPHLFFCRNQRNGSKERTYYEAIREAFRDISGNFDFDLSLDSGQAVSIDFKPSNGVARPASDCGLGLHDMLIIVAVAIWGSHTAVCIEEPENHIHPDMQRRLLAFLRRTTEKQFFLSTHSNVFVNEAFVDRVFFTTYKDSSVIVDDVTSRASILHNIGYSVTDNLVSDLVILVEGPSDVPVVEEFLDKLGLAAKYNIKMWPLGGDIMDQLDLSVFAERYKMLALVDLDPGSGRVRRRFLANCEGAGIERFQLQRYAIENYFALNALRSVFVNQIPTPLIAINPDVPLQEQIGINVKNNNRKIARAMSLDDIAGTDLELFFRRVDERLRTGR